MIKVISISINKKNNYKLYNQITSGNITIHILTDEKQVPKGYKSYKLKIDNKEYIGYKLNKEDDFLNLWRKC